MNPWIAKAVILAASVVMVVIRAPHGRRSRGVKVARSCKGPREAALLTLAWMGFSRSFALGRVPCLFVRPVFASSLVVRRWRPVPCGGPLVVPAVTLGPRDVLVGHP